MGQVYGVPGEIRTHDPQIRNLVLYPAELRGLAVGHCIPRARAMGYRVQKNMRFKFTSHEMRVAPFMLKYRVETRPTL